MKFFRNISLLGTVILVILMSGCDKTKPYDVAFSAPQAHFVGAAKQLYSVVDNPAPSFTLQIGTTDVASSDRIVTYNVSSPTGAVQGTQYTITGDGTVTIPANGAVAPITIQANYSEYASGRIDTLIFSLATPSIEVAGFQDTVKVILKGPSGCTEDVVDLNVLLGDYTTTNEVFDGTPYGPYTTSIASATQTGPSTGTIVVNNIFDSGWGSITFELDWSDPANRTAIVVDEVIPGTDAGTVFGPDYDGVPMVVTTPFGAIASSPTGTYSFCDQTFTLQMEIGIDGVGYYPGLYTVNMAR